MRSSRSQVKRDWHPLKRGAAIQRSLQRPGVAPLLLLALSPAWAGGNSETLTPGWDSFPPLSSGSVNWSVPAGGRSLTLDYTLAGAEANQGHMVGLHHMDADRTIVVGGGTTSIGGGVPQSITREGRTSSVLDTTFGFLTTDANGAAAQHFAFADLNSGLYNVQFHVREGGAPGCPTTSCNAIYRSGSQFALNLVRFTIPGANAIWGGDGNLNDSLGSNDLVAVGSVGFATGHFRQGFSLDGNAHLQVANPGSAGLAFAAGFTVAAWIRPTAVVDTASIINLRTSANSSGFTLEPAFQNPGSILFAVNTTGQSGGFTTLNANGFPAGELHWVAASFDAASHTLKLYRDGELVASRNDAPGGNMMLLGTEQLQVGRNIVNGPRYNGLIDDVLYFDREIAPADLMALFADRLLRDGFE